MRNAHVWANAHHKESAVILVRYLKLAPDVVDAMTRAGFGTTLEPGLVDPLLSTATKYGLLGARDPRGRDYLDSAVKMRSAVSGSEKMRTPAAR